MTTSSSLGPAPQARDADFATMVDFIPQLAWMAQPDGWIFWYNRRWFDYTGTTIDEMKGWGWKAVHHPDHVDRVVEKFSSAIQRGEPWEDLFPLLSAEGEFRWFLSRAMPIRDANGAIVRWFGTNTDVTEQKRNEERQTLLMREIDHRAKNALAVALAVARLTKAKSAEEYKTSVESRIAALARAHGLLAESRWEGADFARLVAEELEPFHAPNDGRVTLSGPAVALQPAPAQSLVLVIHELAMNASKFGALRDEEGRLDVSWSFDRGRFEMVWRETCSGPVREPDTAGFGSTLLEQLLSDFSDASLERDWSPSGLTLRLRASFAEPASAASAMTSAQQATGARDTWTVLVLEDEVLTAMDITQQLTRAGYTVLGPAGTIEQARTALEKEQPDLALLDSNVRGEKSWDLAVDLTHDAVPVIFCTGYEKLDGLPDILSRCPKITKPFTNADLLAAVTSICPIKA